MSDSERDINDEVRAAWDANAAFWDAHMGHDGGGTWQKQMLEPALDSLLGDVSGTRLLELGCGNGQYARHLADGGASVVACDFSPAQLEHAGRRSEGYEGRIEYRLLDAADVRAVGESAPESFGAAVCNMAIMDMAEIVPVFQGVGQVLQRGGPFVLSTLHPCFNTASPTLVEERIEEPGRPLRSEYSLKLSRYKTSYTWRGEAIAGQPVLQPYFHRPLEEIFGTAFAAGFVVDGLLEPALSEEPGEETRLGWSRLREIPPVLVARFRRL